MSRAVSEEVLSVPADVLDHAREFVELVARSAPAEFRRLAESPRLSPVLAQENNFNHGKLFAYAQFVVFRGEFRVRFPGASPAACVNAFCKLFLKNDISMTNLVNFIEGSAGEDRKRLGNAG